MTGQTFANATFWSYGLATVVYVLVAVRMAIGLKRSRNGLLLLFVILATCAWTATATAFAVTGRSDTLWANLFADTVRYGLWYAFVASLLVAGNGDKHQALPRWTIVLASLVLLASVALSLLKLVAPGLQLDPRVALAVQLGMAVLGLVFIEQLYRFAHPQARWAIKPIVVALAAIFGYDLFLYAEALLFSRIDVDIWVARGFANALVVPFIVVATARNRGWTIEIHLSRDAVFHSTALLVSGLFLLAVAFAGYLVRYVGGEWGRVLQIELVFAAAVFIALVATSGRFRSRLKVFVSKHFFSYRYDYREEWLRFTRTLSTESPIHGIQERAIMSLADLVEAPGGAAWLADEHQRYVHSARLNMAPFEALLPAGDPLTEFLQRTGWIIVIPEALAEPARYPGLVFPEAITALADAWLIVPLSTGAKLIGFVVLSSPRTPVEVDWEVRDLLKAAARAAAVYLQQTRATEALLEARKFDAFNRMSAFVVHDLKNLIAQLSLMLRNAERHRDNPEFQRDMLDTVQHVVTRMNGLMLQLRTSATPVENARPVDLVSIVQRVCAAKTIGKRSIELELAGSVQALGHEERLEHVIGHLVQNALDATADGGQVRISVGRHEGFASVEVVDTGVGMSEQFQRERLFKPFESTKASGMGIGVYESQQYVAGLGGRIAVDSSEGKGTRVSVLIPSAEGSGSPSHPLEEAA